MNSKLVEVMEPKIMILLGSASDFAIAEKAIDILETMEIPYDLHVASAHRTHQKVKQIVTESTNNGVEVFMGIAGLSAHLPGIIAANTHKPVVGVPVNVKLEGLDALFASVQMPQGAPVATVGIDRGENGAILASQIIGIRDHEVRRNLSHMRREFFFKVDKDEKSLGEKLKGKYYTKNIFEEKLDNSTNKINNGDKPDIAIIAGSYTDIKVAEKTTGLLDKLNITYDLKIISPIRDPEAFEEYMGEMEDVKLFIAISGLSAHVTGSVVAYTEKPVIGVPCSIRLDGLDALLSMVDMPPGVPVATMGIDEGGNAALLAAEMLAIGNKELQDNLLNLKKNQEHS
ncbi:MAG: N5-carboxyaminoimidazole ribonucleotide mutase [Methanobacterium sp. PtaU1.Bin097]|jgi:5-(carboxyamino)imidazole ribonucleotide mutase|nr:MAG: N5-carboxyaminoimidazole ribonucleotide mutase [Methanobacterium sp. PtaU1.Bin097]